jgi:hypothetical protein
VPVLSQLRDLRQATTSSFKALSEDLAGLRTLVDIGFSEMRSKFDAAAASQQRIVDLLATLIGRQGDDQPGKTDR